MRIVFLAVLALAGCGKSRCEKYAEMEIRCDREPRDEEAIQRRISEGFCEQTDSTLRDSIGPKIAREADCAEKLYKKGGADCEAYLACKAAARQ